ncbi:hypothetical protein EU537_09660 [Candidatus Thorarchaeota archaeon]|nr:MAG: hypothetical protein EU537_09660 [Candidatus Thorarchaeota archaeon]
MTEDENHEGIFDYDEDGKVNFIDRITTQLEFVGGVEIARRYLAMNSFDGVLPVIGIVLGGIISLANSPPEAVYTTTLLAAIGTGLAMFVSGISSSYLTEQAERKREFKALEYSMLSDLSKSAYAKATRTTTIVVSLINGLSPTLSVIATIAPLVLVPLGIASVFVAFIYCVVAGLVLLFILGVFLGSVSRESIISYGLKTLAAGLIVVVLMWVISLLTGA